MAYYCQGSLSIIILPGPPDSRVPSVLRQYSYDFQAHKEDMYLSKDASPHVREVTSVGGVCAQTPLLGLLMRSVSWPGHNPTSEVPDLPVLPRPGGAFQAIAPGARGWVRGGPFRSMQDFSEGHLEGRGARRGKNDLRGSGPPGPIDFRPLNQNPVIGVPSPPGQYEWHGNFFTFSSRGNQQQTPPALGLPPNFKMENARRSVGHLCP